MILPDGSSPASSGQLRRTAAAAVLAALTLTATACTGGEEDEPISEGSSPEEVMQGAKQVLDETSGVELRLSTADEPEGDAVLVSAEGTITDAPAFEGTVTGSIEGFSASDIGVVSVDGNVWIDVPIQGWTDQYDPADFCAPDPATLLHPDSGVSTVLTSTEDLEAGGSERGGPDNEEVLTTYAGTVPGDAIRNILPCSAGEEFEATYTVNADGQLREAVLTGEFYAGGDPITYAIEILEYDVERDINPPAGASRR